MRKKLLCEFIGTYALVFMGTGAVIVDYQTQSLSLVGIALAFGLTLIAMIYSFGHISGAHLNPAVTAAFWIRRQISSLDAFSYVLTQLLAALLASSTLYSLFGNAALLGATQPHNGWYTSLLVEFILTFFLVTVIFCSAVHGKAEKSFAGLVIGSTVVVEILFAGPISGASMNPARSIGPAIISGSMDGLWIYIAAPLLGAAASAFVYKLLQE